MKSTATTTNDLKKDFQKLQIDADLANATGLTAASTFTTPVSNHAQNNDDISNGWKTFYNRVDKSTPKAAREINYLDALDKANLLLGQSSVREFNNKSFEDLTNDQQAMMMFMVMKKMDEAFQGSPDKCANLLVGALNPKTNEYKSIMSFVGRGGDSVDKDAEWQVVNRFDGLRKSFVKSVVITRGITIFNARKKMQPFLYMQRECSYICTFNACSALLYYSSYDTANQKATKTNISKYIRDEIDGLKIANMTFPPQKGANLREVLTGLMKCFGEDGENYDMEKIKFKENNEDFIYDTLEVMIRHGKPFVLRIELFPGLYSKGKREFTGKVSDYYKNIEGERPRPEARSYHAVVCIGIKPRHYRTPPKFLIQDSWDLRPAISIGLDLLMDMGLTDDYLQLCKLPNDWRPNPGMGYKSTEESSVSFAGSPMSFDKNNKPFIVTSEKPVQKVPRDVGRYFLNNTEPGQPVVISNYF